MVRKEAKGLLRSLVLDLVCSLLVQISCPSKFVCSLCVCVVLQRQARCPRCRDLGLLEDARHGICISPCLQDGRVSGKRKRGCGFERCFWRQSQRHTSPLSPHLSHHPRLLLPPCPPSLPCTHWCRRPLACFKAALLVLYNSITSGACGGALHRQPRRHVRSRSHRGHAAAIPRTT